MNGTFNVVVKAEDATGNVDPSYNGPVSIYLANNPAGANLLSNGSGSGISLTGTAVAGVATFTNVSVNAAVPVSLTTPVLNGEDIQAAGGILNTTVAPSINVAPTSRPPAWW